MDQDADQTKDRVAAIGQRLTGHAIRQLNALLDTAEARLDLLDAAVDPPESTDAADTPPPAEDQSVPEPCGSRFNHQPHVYSAGPAGTKDARVCPGKTDDPPGTVIGVCADCGEGVIYADSRAGTLAHAYGSRGHKPVLTGADFARLAETPRQDSTREQTMATETDGKTVAVIIRHTKTTAEPVGVFETLEQAGAERDRLANTNCAPGVGYSTYLRPVQREADSP